MNLAERRLHVLRRLALLCALTVLAVTSLSAALRLSKAGLGCADWPACYGSELRVQQQGGVPAAADASAGTVAARVAHRIVASAALLLAITMAMVAFGSRPALRREGLLALAVLGLALFLAVLGFWSRAPRVPAVAIGNLLGGFAMLALCARLAFVRAAPDARLRAAAAVAALLLVAQAALGGLVSASFAGLNCTGWSGCSPAEALQASGWDSLNPWREPVLAAAPPVNPNGALSASLHRYIGLLLALVLVPLAVLALRRGRPRTGALLLALLAAQLATGLAMSALGLPFGLALLHNLLAAALLGTLATLA